MFGWKCIVQSDCSAMRLLDKEEIEELDRHDPYRHSIECKFVKDMLQQGPRAFVSNARVTARALQIEGRVIPLILSDDRMGDSSVCSLQAHYVESPSSQLTQLGKRYESVLARPFLALLRRVIRAGRLGRVVYLNDWLLTTNPQTHFDGRQISEATSMLTSAFPDRALIFRSVNGLTRPAFPEALLAAGYRLIRSRRIYIFDPARPDFRMKENLRKDLRKLRHWDGSIRKAPLDDSSIERVAELYRGLYLRKYTSGNPDFTRQFFRTVINEGLFEVRCLVKSGRILAFTAWKQESNCVLGTLVGYELTRPLEEGLLRMAFALDFAQSLERKLPYHISSGAGYFKRLRGAVPTTEYDAVFCSHLPPRTRRYWLIFRLLMSLAERVEGQRIDFKKAPKNRSW